jgi:hypothetical protein
VGNAIVQKPVVDDAIFLQREHVRAEIEIVQFTTIL